MTITETTAVISWFQSNVGLSDWIIDVSVSEPQGELSCDLSPDQLDTLLGRSASNVGMHIGRIWINIKGHENEEGELGNPKATLIHELLHIFFADVGMEETCDQCEYGINQLASVLLKQYQNDSLNVRIL